MSLYIKNCDEIIGKADYHYEFYSRYLKNERDIIVWLPPSYEHGEKSYPVLYLQDGQNMFNPQTAFTGYDWKIDETATELINADEIEEFIAVGVYNSKDRLEEYNWFNPKGKNYCSFLINELKPFIDETYRTKSGKFNNSVLGSSLGGLISFQLVWNYSKVFGKGACLSNSFWVDDKEVFKMINNDDEQLKDIEIYIDCGTGETQLIEDNERMVNLLQSLGYEYDNRLMYYFPEGAKHTEFDWAQRVHLPLKFLFGK